MAETSCRRAESCLTSVWLIHPKMKKLVICFQNIIHVCAHGTSSHIVPNLTPVMPNAIGWIAMLTDSLIEIAFSLDVKCYNEMLVHSKLNRSYSLWEILLHSYSSSSSRRAAWNEYLEDGFPFNHSFNNSAIMNSSELSFVVIQRQQETIPEEHLHPSWTQWGYSLKHLYSVLL